MSISDNIIGAESGGNPYAANPNSSTAGPGQFIDATWLNMLNKYRPDLAGSMSQSDLLALKSDPTLSKQMVDAYANENGQVLKQNGFQASPGNLYLAHFAGPEGATNILGSDPGTPIEGVLGQKAVAANPFLRGMTAGDVVSWAGRRMGGAVSGPQTSTPSAAAPTAAGLLAPPSQGSGNSNNSTGLLGGLLAQRQPGQPQTTQDDGPVGLLKVAGLQPAARTARPVPQFMTRRRFG